MLSDTIIQGGLSEQLLGRLYQELLMRKKQIQIYLLIVPQDLIKIINENGGSIKETYGVPVSEIQEGIKNGVRKINIDTDLRLASTAAIRKHFNEDPAQFDPRKYLLDSKNAMKVIVKQRLEEFGTAGNASKIKPTPLSSMSKHYSDGQLTQIIS